MRAVSTAASVVRHSLGAVGEALLIAAIIAALLLALAPVYKPADFLAGTGSAQAAKGGNGGGGKTSTSSLSLVLLDSTDGFAHHTQRVAFDVSTTATDRPFVGVRCWQGTDWVLDAYTGYFESYMFDPWVTLDSDYWTPGVDATCTARLFYYDKRGNQKVLATLDFPALR
ncbi:MAG TPA: hypothetical protein VM344_04920 [Vitreimonas sp.]|nr:hypothetical protein [Vitreimonas sp.]